MPHTDPNDDERDFRDRLAVQLAEAAALHAEPRPSPNRNSIYLRAYAGTIRLLNDVLGHRSNY